MLRFVHYHDKLSTAGPVVLTSQFAVQDEAQEDVTIFMGVPTMYSYLLSAYDDMSTVEQARARCSHRPLPSAPCRLALSVKLSAPVRGSAGRPWHGFD